MGAIDCPFHVGASIVDKLRRQTPVIIVDFHAEATAEKISMGWHLDGKVSAVIGTHTHIQTADASILPGGTAFISDVGMTGPYNSVLGRRTDRVLGSQLSGMPSPFDVAEGDARMCGIVAVVDSETGRATSIERIRIDDVGEGGENSGA